MKHRAKSWVKQKEPYQPLNREEMQDFEKIYALHAFIKNAGTLEKRLRQLHLWQYLRPAVGLLRKVIQGVIDSLPDRQLQHMENVRLKYFVYIQPKPIIGRLADDVVIRRDDLQMLCESAARDRCMMCMACGKEREQCPYRGLFLQFAPPKESNGGMCEYAMMDVEGAEIGGMLLDEVEA